MEMIATAQKLATRYEIPGEEIEAFALRSHRRAAAARDSGRLAKAIVAVQILGERRRPAWSLGHDEGIRDDTTLERLAGLPPQSGLR
jgi:acetyl-CoA acetyltransferase